MVYGFTRVSVSLTLISRRMLGHTNGWQLRPLVSPHESWLKCTSQHILGMIMSNNVTRCTTLLHNVLQVYINDTFENTFLLDADKVITCYLMSTRSKISSPWIDTKLQNYNLKYPNALH